MLRVTVQWGGSGQGLPYFSTHYFAGETEEQADAAVAAVDDFWQGLSTAIHGALVPVILPEVESISPASGQTIAVFTTTPPQPDMTGASEPLPWATQGLIRWRTGVFVGGREIRGRTFIPGVLEANNAVGVPATSLLTIFQVAADAMLSASSAAGGLVVYSRTKGQAALVASGSPWNQWATVRSRRD